MMLLRTAPFMRLVAPCILLMSPLASAQFVDSFDEGVASDSQGRVGWAYFTGDGRATVEFEKGAGGYASIRVDASEDRRNIWWALIKREVSQQMDLARLADPHHELRIEARVRSSHAPRRVNLHLNTQRTTDFHSHLMEFDLAEADVWHTISMTTRDFDAVPGDRVFGQLALMDWGPERYQLDVDYFKVDIVDRHRAVPDLGTAVPYHPPIADPASFAISVPAAHDAVLALDYPEVNFDEWSLLEGGRQTPVLTVGNSHFTVVRFDLSSLRGKRVADHGLLELTTHSVQRKATDVKDSGQIRIVEILGGDPMWNQKSVTLKSFTRGRPLGEVLNGQMIIDLPIEETNSGKTYFTISRPVLQRLLDGKTLGFAIKPLGAIDASFYASETAEGVQGPRLLLNLAESSKR